jgi:excisionase family DNA binding protein
VNKTWHPAQARLGRMTTTHSSKPAPDSAPAAERRVPRHVGRPGPGSPVERLAYSVDEAAGLARLSRDLPYDETRRGHLAYIKVGRRCLITGRRLEQFLNITPSSRSFPAGTPSQLKAADGAP